MNLLNREVLENLIKEGFDLKLIAFELKVPIEKLEEYKRVMEKYNLLKSDKNEKSDYNVINREIQRMRSKYKELYNDKKENENYLNQFYSSINAKSDEDNQEAEMILNKIRELLESGAEENVLQQKKMVKEICAQYKKIMLNKISFNQQVELYKLLKHELLTNFEKTALSNKMFRNFKADRCHVAKIISDTLTEKLKATEELEELEKLREIANILIGEDNRIIVSAIKGNISTKIRKVQNEKAILDFKIVPSSIVEITKKLVDGTLNFQESIRKIELEAQKLCDTKNASGVLNYTNDIAQKRIYEQIHGLIRENAQNYSIGNVEQLIDNLSVLTKKDKVTSLKTVIANMTQRKEFQRAKVMCEIYGGNDEKSELYQVFRNIKKGIERIEISNIALNMISGGTQEEEMEWFNKLNNINKLGIKPEAVILGKSLSGKEIKLSSVLDEEINI